MAILEAAGGDSEQWLAPSDFTESLSNSDTSFPENPKPKSKPQPRSQHSQSHHTLHAHLSQFPPSSKPPPPVAKDPPQPRRKPSSTKSRHPPTSARAGHVMQSIGMGEDDTMPLPPSHNPDVSSTKFNEVQHMLRVGSLGNKSVAKWANNFREQSAGTAAPQRPPWNSNLKRDVGWSSNPIVAAQQKAAASRPRPASTSTRTSSTPPPQLRGGGGDHVAYRQDDRHVPKHSHAPTEWDYHTPGALDEMAYEPAPMRGGYWSSQQPMKPADSRMPSSHVNTHHVPWERLY